METLTYEHGEWWIGQELTLEGVSEGVVATLEVGGYSLAKSPVGPGGVVRFFGRGSRIPTLTLYVCVGGEPIPRKHISGETVESKYPLESIKLPVHILSDPPRPELIDPKIGNNYLLVEGWLVAPQHITQN